MAVYFLNNFARGSNIKRIEERKKNPKKQGGQPEYKKYERKLVSLNKVDHVISCCPDDRCACGGQIILHSKYRRHQQYEFPIIRPIVTEYQIYSGSRSQCNQTAIIYEERALCQTLFLKISNKSEIIQPSKSRISDWNIPEPALNHK